MMNQGMPNLQSLLHEHTSTLLQFEDENDDSQNLRLRLQMCCSSSLLHTLYLLQVLEKAGFSCILEIFDADANEESQLILCIK